MYQQFNDHFTLTFQQQNYWNTLLIITNLSLYKLYLEHLIKHPSKLIQLIQLTQLTQLTQQIPQTQQTQQTQQTPQTQQTQS